MKDMLLRIAKALHGENYAAIVYKDRMVMVVDQKPDGMTYIVEPMPLYNREVYIAPLAGLVYAQPHEGDTLVYSEGTWYAAVAGGVHYPVPPDPTASTPINVIELTAPVEPL